MSTVATYEVSGMSCGHCVHAVTEELLHLEGVRSVDVALATEGASQVTVTSDAPLSPAAVREAIDEAGYALVPS